MTRTPLKLWLKPCKAEDPEQRWFFTQYEVGEPWLSWLLRRSEYKAPCLAFSCVTNIHSCCHDCHDCYDYELYFLSDRPKKCSTIFRKFFSFDHTSVSKKAFWWIPNFWRSVWFRLMILIVFQEEGLIEKEKRIERESIEAGEDGEMRHTELW